MKNPPARKRHPDNPNLRQFEDDRYHSMPVCTSGGPLIEEYLERIDDVLQGSLRCHPRITAMRFDLRLPAGVDMPVEDNRLMTDFWRRLKERIDHARNQASKRLANAHDTEVQYLWTREYDQGRGRPHWHCLLLVNKDAFYGMGSFESENSNTYWRIVSAWCAALGLATEQGQPLVHVPDTAVYHVDREDRDGAYAKLFFRASYFAKMKTKAYHGHVNAFGGSQIRC
jgi:hypothetical protein